MGRRERTHAEDVPDHIITLVRTMAQGMVQHPDEVEVDLVDDEEDDRPYIELRVHPEDLGQVIGKNGRTSKAMRLLVNAAATKAGVHVGFDIIDDESEYEYVDDVAEKPENEERGVRRPHGRFEEEEEGDEEEGDEEEEDQDDEGAEDEDEDNGDYDDDDYDDDDYDPDEE